MNEIMIKPNVTDEMVSRFLGWKLPMDFYPDCYVSFDKDKASGASWPTGTNLFTAAQARAMLEHILAKPLEPHQQRVVDEHDELLKKAIALGAFSGSDTFQRLDQAEQERLTRQWKLMQQYGQVLAERIAAFK